MTDETKIAHAATPSVCSDCVADILARLNDAPVVITPVYCPHRSTMVTVISHDGRVTRWQLEGPLTHAEAMKRAAMARENLEGMGLTGSRAVN